MEEKKPTSTFDYAQFNKLAQDLISKKVYLSDKAESSGRTYPLEQIISAKERGDAKTAREISRFYYDTNTSYARIVDHMANFYKYYYTLDLKNLEEGGKSDKVLKTYRETLNLLDRMNVEQTLGEFSKRVLVDGVYNGYITHYTDGTVGITQLDPDFCRSRIRSTWNTDIVQMDMKFFDKFRDEKDKKEVLKTFPPEIQKGYRAYLKNDDFRWVNFEPQNACSFSFDSSSEVNFPRLYDTIIDICNYEDYKEIEKKRDTNELEKILIQKFKLNENSDLTTLMQEMAAMHKAVADMLREQPNIDVITTLADEMKIEDIQESKQATSNNIEKMVMPKYEGAGVSYELFGSSTATALERNLANTTSFMSQLIVKYSNWLSMLCYTTFDYKKSYPIVTILPITWYNEDKLMDLYLKGAQYGYSWILPWVATGKKQSALLDTITMEQDILGLGDKMRPLSSSFTSSNGGGKGAPGAGIAGRKAGRPPLSNEDRSEKTLQNINSM